MVVFLGGLSIVFGGFWRSGLTVFVVLGVVNKEPWAVFRGVEFRGEKNSLMFMLLGKVGWVGVGRLEEFKAQKRRQVTNPCTFMEEQLRKDPPETQRAD